jgi:hypothetical protein
MVVADAGRAEVTAGAATGSSGASPRTTSRPRASACGTIRAAVLPAGSRRVLATVSVTARLPGTVTSGPRRVANVGLVPRAPRLAQEHRPAARTRAPAAHRAAAAGPAPTSARHPHVPCDSAVPRDLHEAPLRADADQRVAVREALRTRDVARVETCSPSAVVAPTRLGRRRRLPGLHRRDDAVRVDRRHELQHARERPRGAAGRRCRRRGSSRPRANVHRAGRRAAASMHPLPGATPDCPSATGAPPRAPDVRPATCAPRPSWSSGRSPRSRRSRASTARSGRASRRSRSHSCAANLRSCAGGRLRGPRAARRRNPAPADVSPPRRAPLRSSVGPSLRRRRRS